MSLNKKTFNTSSASYIAGLFLYQGGETSNDRTIVTNMEPDLVWIFPNYDNGMTQRQSYIIDKAFPGSDETFMRSNEKYIVRQNNPIITWNTDGFTLKARNDWWYSNTPDSHFMDGSSYYCGIAFQTAASGATNNDGNTTATVYANTEGNYSKIFFTSGGSSTTIGHGLSAAPTWMLCMRIDASMSGSSRYEGKQGATMYDFVNSEYKGEASHGSGFYKRPLDSSSSHLTADSSTISVHSSDNLGGTNGGDYVIYAFAPKAGFSDHEGFTGNGSSSGRTVLSADFDPLVIFMGGEHDMSMFHAYRRNSGTPVTGDIVWTDAEHINNKEQGGNNLTDQEASVIMGGTLGTQSVRASHSSNNFQLNASDSGVNGSGRVFSIFAMGGDLIYYDTSQT